MFVYDDRYNQMEVYMESVNDQQTVNESTHHLIDDAVDLLSSEVIPYYNNIKTALTDLKTYVSMSNYEKANELKNHIINLFKEWDHWYLTDASDPPKVSQEQEENDMTVYKYLYGEFTLTLKTMEDFKMTTDEQSQKDMEETINDLKNSNEYLKQQKEQMEEIKRLTEENTILKSNLQQAGQMIMDSQKKQEAAETTSTIAMVLGGLGAVAGIGTVLYNIFSDD